MARYIGALELKTLINEVGKGCNELTLIDVREPGQFGANHMLHAIPCPYSEIEIHANRLMPRKSVPIVLVDSGNGTAEKSVKRLIGLGYTDISILASGNEAWSEAGFEVFQGVNVPSKAFGEIVEHQMETPRISAEELHQMMQKNNNIVVIDGRTPGEHLRMSIPGGISLPNAEMLYRIKDLVPEEETLIVVNCAGRTRSIIGAQGLINAGLPNPIVALKAGTMGWTLAGYELEHGSVLSYPEEPSASALAAASGYADELISKFDLSIIELDELREWKADDKRTLFLIDIRTEREYLAGHLADAVHAPGGQLVQATDAWCGVWGARVVLVDDIPNSRSAMAAHWLKQMGWDVHILDGSLIQKIAKEKGSKKNQFHQNAEYKKISCLELMKKIENNTVVIVDVGNSMDYREQHIPGATWCPRARISTLQIPRDKDVVVYSDSEERSRLAAIDLSEVTDRTVILLEAGRQGWLASDLPVETSPDIPKDSDCIDYLFWVSRRHMGNNAAARAYLQWEENLPAQIRADGDARFTVLTP